MSEQLLTLEEINTIVENINIELLQVEIGKIEVINIEEVETIDLDKLSIRFGGLVDPIGQLQSWLASVLSDFSEWITSNVEDIFNSIITPIASTINTIYNTVIAIPGSFEQVFSWFSDIYNFLKSFLDTVSQSFDSLTKTFQEFVVEPVTEAINSALNFLTVDLPNAINSLISSITNFLTTDLPNTIASTIASISKTISDTFANVISSVETFFKQTLPSLFKEAGKKISEFIASASKGISDFIATIQEALKPIQEALAGIVSFIQDKLQGAIKGIGEALTTALGWLPKPEEIPQAIAKALAYSFGIAIDTLQAGINAVSEKWKGFIAWFTENIIIPVWENLKAFWDWINKILDPIKTTLQSLSASFQGFVNPLASIWGFLQSIQENITNFFKNVSEFFAKDPITMIKDALWGFIQTGIETLSSWINTLIEKVKGFASIIWDALVNLGKTITKTATNTIENLITFTKGITDTISKTFNTFMKENIFSILPSLTKSFYEKVKQLATGGQAGEFELIPLGLGLIGGSLVLSRLISGIIYSIGQNIHTEITIGIPGTNIRFPFKPGWFLMELGKTLWDVPSELLRGVTYGWSIWLTQPLARGVNAVVRNMIPVELPSLAEMQEVLRRTLPLKEFKEFRESVRTKLMLYGYSDEVIDWILKEAGEFYVTITDRFKKERKIPLALMFRLPSPSDFIRMMIHDIIVDPKEFEKAMMLAGMTSDLAYMYYMLHFRYVTPEQLWSFISRAHAKLLWFTPTPDMEKEAEAEAKSVGAYKPVPPVKLNVTTTKISDLLTNALISYMKWHDYARFSWIQGFTSDNWMIIDLLSDIPTRIDARWMYKWGVWSSYDPKTYKSDSLELSRIAIARGVHPKYVPLISIAECMNALSEERTLLRTGVMNALEYGFLTPGKFDKIMSSLVNLSFTVFEYNPERRMFLPKNVTVPVKFLEGERLLLLKRSLYDRAIGLLRELSRELRTAVSENMIELDTYKQVMKEAVNTINQIINSALEEAKIPLTFDLALDESYLAFYEKVLESYRSVYTYRRIRYWLNWLLWGFLYRLQYGYIKGEELDNTLNEIKKHGRLTDEEIGVLKTVAEFVLKYFTRSIKVKAVLSKLRKRVITVEQAKKELMAIGIEEDIVDDLIESEVRTYVPYPTTLGTFAEYIELPENYIDAVLEMNGVPKQDKEIWKQYISIKPVSSEAKEVANELVMLYAYNLITDQELERELRALEKYGITPRERELLIKKAKLRRLRYAKT